MAKKRSSAKMADNNSSPSVSFKNEVILWAVLALSIILFISNFGIAGKAGNFISSIFFGLFGFTAYIFPFLLFGGTAFAIANKDNTVAVIKEAAAAGFFIFVCMFLELIGGKGGTPFDSYVWSAEHKFGGGLAGGLLTWLVKPNLGTVSAYVIDIIMMIICMVLVTQRSLWKPIQSGGRKMYDTARQETARQRQQYTERRQRRMDNKVTGVSADTSIKNTAKQRISDDVSEIRPDTAFVPDFPIHMMNQTAAEKKSREDAQAQEKLLQNQAVGLEYADVMPFPAKMGSAFSRDLSKENFNEKTEPADKLDNIVPIKNRKVVLKPSLSVDAGSREQESPGISGIQKEDDILGKTSDIFSGLLPEPEAGGRNGMLSAAEPDFNAAAVAADDVSDEETDFASMDFFGTDFQDKQSEGENQKEVRDTKRSAGISTDYDINSSGSYRSDSYDAAPGTVSHAENYGTGGTESYGTDSYAESFGTDSYTENYGTDSYAESYGTDSYAKGYGTGGYAESYGAGSDGVFDIGQEEESDMDLSGVNFDAPAATAQELIAQQLQAAKTVPPKASAAKTKQSQAEIASDTAGIDVQLRQAQLVPKKEYVLPSVDLLKLPNPDQTGDTREHLQETALKLQQTLKNFGVNVTILNVSCGPAVTRYEIQPEMGVKVSKIVNLADDIKLNLAAADIRIEAPIPGKAAIGIEVPNKETVPVMFRELIESEAFKRHASPCAFAAGKDIAGQVVVTDICKMPHLLIAGATGSGKSVCINTIIMSIIYKSNPDDVKLIMIDPKVVELSVYNGIPHLLLPVVTDPKKAAGALHWAVSEMMDRYQKFADFGVRDMKGYNAKIKKTADIPGTDKPQKMPYIVIIVDELADLMMAAPGDVEDAICRLAQLARAAGMHLIIATQRPSVNVITGLIKANMPSRIAFSVTSGIDSRTILDMNGAEKLLGKGDMLFYPQGLPKPVRVQGAFVSDAEVSDVVEFLTSQNGATQYSSEIQEKIADAASSTGSSAADASSGDDRDVYFADAAKLLIDKDKASVSMLQRYFKIGFNRAARIMDQLEEAGVVGPEEGTKPRKIMMSPEEFAQYEEEVL